MNNEHGDFQTPVQLTAQIIRKLIEGRSWRCLLEPTCGQGNFITTARATGCFEHIIGVELQPQYAQMAAAAFADYPEVKIILADVFDLHFTEVVGLHATGQAEVLVLGNPPWVTAAGQRVLSSENLPTKSNFKALKGLEALTGSANFDISEFIWLKLIYELYSQRPTIALLCKSSVARNVLKFCFEKGLSVSGGKFFGINAKMWFNAAVDAGLFVLEVNTPETRYDLEIYPNLEADTPERTIGFRYGQLIADLEAFDETSFLFGTTRWAWRQGVKHDAGTVVELVQQPDGVLVNKLGETVDIEEQYVYPFLKGTDVYKSTEATRRLRVIIPQRTLNEPTEQLVQTAPKLWHYLVRNEDYFSRRKSSIYTRAPQFGYFGIGTYSFAPYKVAVSGMHKEPVFRLVAPVDGKPVMLDDTCYFIGFDSESEAGTVCEALNSNIARRFLKSMMFTDAKRPITKNVLQKLAIQKLVPEQPTELSTTLGSLF
jgi:hypothetical protein